ncbi:MAG: hypothetical protein HXS52_12545 [Theionarchaea archaeon]|nr:hypothetical protein [Theionarchaea archaeon]MBU7038752.1 hypothetical protein [Theionarchaea archaeon]
MEPEKKKRIIDTGGILFALFILLLGVFSMLLDVSPFAGIFYLLKFWPVLLIGLGIWLVFKHAQHEGIGAVVLAVLLVVAVYSAFSQVEVQSFHSEEKELSSGLTDLEASLDLLFGVFSVDAASDNLYILKGYESMDSSFYTAGSTGYLDLSLTAESFIPLAGSHEAEILLTDTLPLVVHADAAFSTVKFDASRLNIQELVITGGLSSFELVLGETNTDISLSMGMSSVTIYVPQTVGVRIVSTGLTSLSVPTGWIKIDDGYMSPNYDTALYRIEVDSSTGLGTIVVKYVDLF